MKKKIKECFKEAVKSKEDLLNLIIGGVLTFFPVANLIALGYLTEKLRKNLENEPKTVKWENFGYLLKLGWKTFILIFGYFFISIFFVFLGDIFIFSLSEGKFLSIFFLRGLVLINIGTIVFLIALFFLPFSIPVFLETNSMKKGFDLKEILGRILLKLNDYLVIYLTILGILVFSFAITFLFFNWVTGLLLSGFLYFYVGLIIVNIISKFFPRKYFKVQLPF